MKKFILIGFFLLLSVSGFFWMQREKPVYGPKHFVALPSSTPSEKLYRQIHEAADRDIVVLSNSSQEMSERLDSIYQNPKVWMTLPDAEGTVSFYAGLFKQVKLEDVFTGKMLTSLVELSGSHAVSVQDKSGFIAEQDRRHPYQPASKIEKQPLLVKEADLVVFSFDRPLQLYAFLESMEKHVKGLSSVYAIYRSSNDNYRRGYEKVQQQFKHVRFLQQGSNPAQDFKPLFLKAAFQSPSPYLMLAVDDIIVKTEVNVGRCVEVLEKTQSFGCFLRLGKHIDHCYMTNSFQKIPPSWEVDDGVFAWQFKQGDLDWKYPCSVDMSLYKKSDIEQVLRKIDYRNPNLLESEWALKARFNKMGLYFEESKVVNLPLNMVNESNIWYNRQMQSYTTQELLEKFEAGLKIDINSFSNIIHRSPHIEGKVTLVTRHDE